MLKAKRYLKWQAASQNNLRRLTFPNVLDSCMHDYCFRCCINVPSLFRMCPVELWGRLWWTLWMYAGGTEMVRVSSNICHWERMLIFPSSFSFLSPDSAQVLQVADALCAQLSSQDLIGNTARSAGEEREEKKVVPSPSCQTSANPLLISC